MFKEFIELTKAATKWFCKYWKQYLGICIIIYGCISGWFYRKEIVLKLKKFKKTKKVGS